MWRMGDVVENFAGFHEILCSVLNRYPRYKVQQKMLCDETFSSLSESAGKRGAMAIIEFLETHIES